MSKLYQIFNKARPQVELRRRAIRSRPRLAVAPVRDIAVPFESCRAVLKHSTTRTKLTFCARCRTRTCDHPGVNGVLYQLS